MMINNRKFALFAGCGLALSLLTTSHTVTASSTTALPALSVSIGQSKTVTIPCDRSNPRAVCSVSLSSGESLAQNSTPDNTPALWDYCTYSAYNIYGITLWTNKINVDYMGNGSTYPNSSMFNVTQANQSGTFGQLGWQAAPVGWNVAPGGTNYWSTWFDAAGTTSFTLSILGQPLQTQTNTVHYKVVHYHLPAQCYGQ